MVAGAGRASTHDSRVQVQAEHEVGGGGLGPEATPALAKAARALHRALLRIVTVVSCRGKTHNNRPYLSVENSNLLQKPLFWLDLHSSVTKSRSLLSFVRPGKSGTLRRLIVLKWHRPCLIALRRCNRRTFRHNPTSDPHSMSSACPT